MLKKDAVLVCVYKGDSLSDFKACINSIIKNKCRAINIYLHVDGTICEAMSSYINESKDFYKIIYSNKPVGLARGLNKLIDQLEDEIYVFRMDADDLVLANRFKMQQEFMDRNRNVDLCGGEITEFEGSEKNITFRRTYPIEHRNIVAALTTHSPFAHVTICFRRDIFEKFGNYPTEYPLNEDIAYWFKLLKSGAIAANIPRELVAVRMDGAYERRKVSKAWPEFKVYWNVCMWQRKLPFKPLLRLLFRLFPAWLVEMVYKSFIRRLIVK